MSIKRYNVCVPRKYTDKHGTEKTHFWKVGMMFPMKERDGFNLELYTRVLPTDKLCIFVDQLERTNKEDELPAPENDDIPF